MTDELRPLLLTPLKGPIDAVIRVPGSKSITNRALVCAALAKGKSQLDGVLFADDTQAMLDSLRLLGVEITSDPEVAGRLRVIGNEGALPEGPIEFDARLSGTTSRFLLPLLGIGPGPYLLDGAEPLRRRPMADGLHALTTLGVVVVERGDPGHLPVQIVGSAISPISEIQVRGDASSQFLSGLLLSAPCRQNGLILHIDGDLVSRPYVDLTMAVMRVFGAEVSWDDDRTLLVEPTGYSAASYVIEPDASAASYFFAAAAINGGRIRVEGLGSKSLQGDVQFVDILERMGVGVEKRLDSIDVWGRGSLHGVDADLTDISDTAQTLAVVAAFADSPSTVTGIGFIRRKETDRIHSVVTELSACGIQAEPLEDGFRVHPGLPKPSVVKTYNDHRMAMSFALLGLRAPGIAIADPDVVDKTFPTYWDVLATLGAGGNSVNSRVDG